jgi:NADH-quinone oxidoreductase subunit G
MMTPSVCQGCATGCNTEVHHRDGRAWRIVPRHNPDGNGYWMCDDGRFTYHDLRRDRLGGPVVGGLPASWDRALETAARQLRAALASDRESVGVVLSAQHENEANYVLAKLGLDIWQLDNVYIGGKRAVPERADDKLRDADVNPNTTGVRSILASGHPGADHRGETAAVLEADLLSGDVTALIVLGNDLDLSEEGLEAARNLETLIVIADREVGISRVATVALPSAAWAETTGTVTNRDGRVQQRHAAFGPPGQSLPAWEIVTKLAQACDAALSYADTRSVFTEMVANVAAFEGAAWRRDPRPVQLRWAHSRG